MLPFVLTDFSVSEMIVLRRIALSKDPDILFLLKLLEGEVEARKRLEERLENPEENYPDDDENNEEDQSRRKPGRKPYGEREGEPEIIAKILRFRQMRNPYNKIAQILNKQGIRTRNNKLWRAQQIKDICTRAGRKK
ncbi:recombinase family protein [Fimbriiglobus ruber]|uniref:recombinase family protein n=1 Tax=Fimbriiglobus ruber TaxID=1908690 RepID=UPI00117AB714|nr:recombinase family protein [Fimbriiglobus ruber]